MVSDLGATHIELRFLVGKSQSSIWASSIILFLLQPPPPSTATLAQRPPSPHCHPHLRSPLTSVTHARDGGFQLPHHREWGGNQMMNDNDFMVCCCCLKGKYHLSLYHPFSLMMTIQHMTRHTPWHQRAHKRQPGTYAPERLSPPMRVTPGKIK